MSKTNRTQTENNFNGLIDYFAQLKNNECLNEMEMEGKDIVPRTIQPQKHMNEEHTKAIRQRSNTTKCKREYDKQKHSQENYILIRLGQTSRKQERLCYS